MRAALLTAFVLVAQPAHARDTGAPEPSTATSPEPPELILSEPEREYRSGHSMLIAGAVLAAVAGVALAVSLPFLAVGGDGGTALLLLDVALAGPQLLGGITLAAVGKGLMNAGLDKGFYVAVAPARGGAMLAISKEF
jgi:hypothetical protein